MRLVLALCLLSLVVQPPIALASSRSSSSGSASRGRLGKMPADPDFANWAKPVEGSSSSSVDDGGEASSGILEVGHRAIEQLERGETRLLQFDLDTPSRCELRVGGRGAKPQLAFLDQSTRVAAMGTSASLRPGTYFVRLQARQAGRYTVQLRCPGHRSARHRST